jgi:nitroreductase
VKEILSRRSIRKYTSEPVSDESIQRLLEAAMAAPSAGNEQPWHFIILSDRNILDEIPKFHPYAQMTAQAPVAILVCGDLTKEIHRGYWVQDCSAATENILLTVCEEGLGAVWVGVYPVEERVKAFRKLLNIPEQIVPFALIPIGHPAEQKPPAERFNAELIHRNKW